MASRLIPAHRDSTEEQEAQVPVLGVLTEEQLAAMLSRQLPTEEASLLQWCRSVGVEPPPPPDNVTDALEGTNEMRLKPSWLPSSFAQVVTALPYMCAQALHMSILKVHYSSPADQNLALQQLLLPKTSSW